MDEIETARLAGAQAAQTRISTILTSPEAEGRSALANHLAFSTDVAAEAAVAMLKVAAKEAVAAPASPAASTTEEEQTPAFKAAMKTAVHPQVPAGGGTEQQQEATEEKDGGKRILSAQRAVFGVPDRAAARATTH